MLVPRAGIEPVPPTVGTQRLNHSTAREVPKLVSHVADFPVVDRRRAPTPRGDVCSSVAQSCLSLRGPTDPRPPGSPSFLSRGACMNEEESIAVRPVLSPASCVATSASCVATSASCVATSASCVTARAGGPLLVKRRKMSGERAQSGRFLGGTLGDGGAGGGGVRDEPRVRSELSQNSDPALRPPGPAGSPPRPAPRLRLPVSAQEAAALCWALLPPPDIRLHQTSALAAVRRSAALTAALLDRIGGGRVLAWRIPWTAEPGR